MKTLLSVCLFVAVMCATVSSRADNLFVTINVDASIYKYDTAIGASSQTIFASNIVGTSLLGLAIDTNGNVYTSVVNSGADYGFIYKFTPGGSETNFAIGLDPTCLLFDHSGNLFAPGYNFSGTPTIYEFTPGGTRSTFVTPLGSGLDAANAAFDSSGNLFVAANTSTGSVLKYTPSTNRTVFASGFSSSYGVAFDTNGDLFMTDGLAGKLYKFAMTNGVLTNVPTLFASGFSFPTGLIFDSGGNLYLVDANAYQIFRFNNSGGILSTNAVLFADVTSSGGNPEYLAIGPATAPSRPLLTAKAQGANSVLVSWPSPSAGFVLQQSPSLDPANWTSPNYSTNDNGTIRSVLISSGSGNLFFRLKK